MLARPDRQKGWGQGEAGMEAEESSLQRKTPLVVERCLVATSFGYRIELLPDGNPHGRLNIPGLLPCCEPVNQIASYCVADSGCIRNSNSSARGNFHFWVNDVFCPITAAGGDIAGKSKVR